MSTAPTAMVVPGHAVRIGSDWQLVCSCQEVFKANSMDAAIQAAKQHLKPHRPDEVKRRRRRMEREEERAKKRAERLAALDGGPRTTRELACAWGISKSGTLHWLHRIGCVLHVTRNAWPWPYEWKIAKKD